MVVDVLHRAAWRVLLQAADTPDEAEGPAPEEEPVEEEDHSSTTKNLRIASIFIILAAGLIGGIPPLFFPAFRNPSHPVPRILRALSAGIVIALAFIHILPDAVVEMEALEQDMPEKYPYNPAGAAACFGLILMVVTHSLTHYFLERRAAAKGTAAPSTEPSLAVPAKAVAESYTDPTDPHQHVCVGHAGALANVGSGQPNVKEQVVAAMFELGCIFHSFIIGITLGVNTEDMGSVRGLLIALCFHQWLEGIALSSFIMRARIPTWSGITMVALYALTCPIGVAIGIGVADTYDEESTRAIAITGTFNGVSAGMLMYIGLVQLVAEDFSRRELPGSSVQPLRLGGSDAEDAGAAKPSPEEAASHRVYNAPWVFPVCHLALFLGAAFMAMLAIWA